MKKILLLIFISGNILAQDVKKDKSMFIERKSGYWETDVLRGIEQYEQKILPPENKKRFLIDLSGANVYNNFDLYKTQWCTPPISQGNTGNCWCYSTTSFFETEIYRLSKQEIKLSEIYTVYWEYVEKARRFVKEKGNSYFAEGSEADAVIRIWKTYGIVPYSFYTGLKEGQTVHSHVKMFDEMKGFLESVKQNNAWNEDLVISTIKDILNSYIGVPPTKIVVNGKELSPQGYLKDFLKINLDDYVSVTSILEKPFWEKVEVVVPDNWWLNSNYYNVPLDDFMKVLKKTLRMGYAVSIGGDVSEAGFERYKQVAVVPSFDIPSEYIDDNARQFRFSNKTTTDDHGVHLLGYYEKDGKDWFVVKDSGAGSRYVDKSSKSFGFFFFSEDYVKLKMLFFLVHKDAFKDYIQKFK